MFRCLLLVFAINGFGVLKAQNTVKIKLDSNLVISWNTSLGYILQDANFKTIAEQYEVLRPVILAALNDTTITDYDLCAKSTKLRNADFAWMLLRELKKLSKDCSVRSYNQYKGLCPYPVGLLDAMEANRETFNVQIIACAL